MSLSETLHFLPPNSIKINRAERQRKTISTSGLKESIARNGVMNPLIVTRSGVLVAGERRLSACLELGLTQVPVRYVDELDQTELQVLELEENVKRSDLKWREQVEAIGKLHDIYSAREENWTQSKTAESLSISPYTFSVYYRIWKDFENSRIAGATTLEAAFHILQRMDERKTSEAMESLFQAGAAAFTPKPEGQNPALQGGHGTPGATTPALASSPSTAKNPAFPFDLSPLPAGSTPLPNVHPLPFTPQTLPTIPILNQSFLAFAPTYSGSPFNLIHCDFPYGVGVFDGALRDGPGAEQSENGPHRLNPGLYDDTEKTYWELCKCLCENLDRLMSHSGHLIFWFSMKRYSETLKFFEENAPSLVFDQTPLVWLKSDNRGVCPDPRRKPRQIYETALFASREDRPLCKVQSNAYAAPTDKTYHPSTKPEPMLRYFFSMFVDDTTTLFDPTCGGGSALRAAESLGAKSVFGLELDPEHWAAAISAMKQFRALRK